MKESISIDSFIFFSMDYSKLPSNNFQSMNSEEKTDRIRQTQQYTLLEPKNKSKFLQIFWDSSNKAKAIDFMKSVLIPNIKYNIFNNVFRVCEMLIFGDIQTPNANNYNGRYVKPTPVNYAKCSNNQSSSVNNVGFRYDFSDIIFANAKDASDCLHSMDDIICEYGTCSVGDLLDLVGRIPNKTDWNYVWTNLNDAQIKSTINGYILNFPQPKPR